MTKCIYCQQKKGKRSCPALNGQICSGCCGEHRGRDIACPANCAYLVDHEAYQRERLAAIFLQERQNLYHVIERLGGQKAVQLLHLCDITTYQFFYNKPETFDWELMAGLEHIRRKFSPIKVQVPGTIAYGDFLDKELQEFCKHEQVSSNLVTEVMDHLLIFFKSFSGSELRSNRYCKGLVGFIDRYYPAQASQMREDSTHQKKIILPSTPVGVPLGDS
jgi:hypothetical protein